MRQCTQCGRQAGAAHDAAVKWKIIALLTAAACAGPAWAQDAAYAQEEPAPLIHSTERFTGVTAANGQEWIEQCDRAAQKSDSTVRVSACMSFLLGARMVASKSDAGESCSAEVSRQNRSALWTTISQVARRYPHLPLRKIFAIAFDSLEPVACKKNS
jgi:hypothetical protein